MMPSFCKLELVWLTYSLSKVTVSTVMYQLTAMATITFCKPKVAATK